ncbi:Imm45 family immunity protein [Variovorax paradoxus]
MVISGYRAGIINFILPRESRGDNGIGLKLRWLIEVWKKWIYQMA